MINLPYKKSKIVYIKLRLEFERVILVDFLNIPIHARPRVDTILTTLLKNAFGGVGGGWFEEVDIW